jgi:transcriptional regulator with XRE-family HTH domain
MPEPDEISAAARLGEELRQLRLAAGYPTVQALAARVNGYGESQLAKVEQGRRTASKQLFPAWLGACATHVKDGTPVVTDPLRRALTALWEIALRKEGPIPEFIEKYFEIEAKAAFIRFWGLLVIPGLLQTREYARAMFLTEGIDEEEAAEKTGVRTGRQALLEGPDAAHATAVIHELALHFQVGTPEVMIAQLQHLLALSRRPNFVLQVIPNSGYFPGVRGPFEIASGADIPDTLLILAVEDQMMEDSALTRKSIALFEHIRSYALNAEDSRALITEAIEQWKTRQPQ